MVRETTETKRRPTLSLVLPLLCCLVVSACTQRASTPIPATTDSAPTLTPATRPAEDERQIEAATRPTSRIPPTPPASPAPIEHLELVGYLGTDEAGPVLVQGDYAYVGFDSQLAIVDISDPVRPRRVGYVLLPNRVLDIAVAGSYIYAAAGLAGLHIIDGSDPSRPLVREVRGAGDDFYVDGVVVERKRAYVSAGSLRVMDLSDPAFPLEIGVFSLPEPQFANPVGKVVAVRGNHAYTFFYSNYTKVGGLRIVDVSDPAAPVQLGAFFTGGWVHDATVVGNWAYLLVGQGIPRLVAVDVSDPEHPFEASPDPMTPWLGLSLTGRDRYIYLAYPDSVGTAGGLQVLDVADPAHPVPLGRYEGLATPISDVVVDRQTAYIATGDGLVLLDLSDPAAPVPKGAYHPDAVSRTNRSIALAGDLAYVPAGADGLQVVDVSAPAHPRVIGALDTSGHAWDVALYGSYACLADEYNGLRVIDVRDPAHPVEVGSFDVPGPSEFFASAAIWDEPSFGGPRVYVADALPGDTSLRVIDISDPVNPREMSRLSLAPEEQGDVRAYGLAASDGYVYVAAGTAGLRVIDVSDPGAPVEVGVYDTPGRADSVVVRDARAYVIDGDLRIVDISDPTSPALLGFHDVPDLSPWPYVDVQGRYAYLSAQGVRVLDISDPGRPALVASYPLAWGNVAVAHDMVYAIGDGLHILRPLGRASTGATPLVTPRPECQTYAASMSLSAADTQIQVGDVLTVTVTLTNQGCGMLGLPQYALHIESGQPQPLFDPAIPEPVVHYLGLNTGQSDTADFGLRAVQPGQAALDASGSFEFHASYPGPAHWGGSSTGPLLVTVLPVE